MKKYLGYGIGVLVVVAAGIYWFFTGSSSNTTTATTSTAGSGAANQPGQSPDMPTSTGTEPSSTGNMGGMTMGSYKDGTYTGTVADAVYGKIQVVVTISNSMITNVTWPVYPNEPGHTIQVNDAALPQLKQETITAQSANVNVISGATQTSEGFQQSLASALAQAKS